jgi:DNA-binding PadR family transcriptional regulator
MVISTSARLRDAAERAGEAAVSGEAVTPAVFHIMLVLATGEAHGYAIMRRVDELSAGDTRIGPGTLYRSIQRMLVAGLIEERDISLDDEPEDDRRRYYRLTPKGLAAARAEASRLATLVELARAQKLLGPSRKPGGKR